MHPLHDILSTQIDEDDGTISLIWHSGPGMAGRRCLAVLMPHATPVGVLFAFVLEGMRGDEHPIDDHDNDLLQDAFSNMKQDRSGRSAVYYFPDVEEPEDESTDR